MSDNLAPIPEMTEFARRFRDDPGLAAAREVAGQQVRAFAVQFTTAMRSLEIADAAGGTP